MPSPERARRALLLLGAAFPVALLSACGTNSPAPAATVSPTATAATSGPAPKPALPLVASRDYGEDAHLRRGSVSRHPRSAQEAQAGGSTSGRTVAAHCWCTKIKMVNSVIGTGR